MEGVFVLFEQIVAAVRAVRTYIGRGFAPVPVPFQEKGPKLKGWQHLRLAEADVDQYFPPGVPMNVGLILGEASGDLTDIGLDELQALTGFTDKVLDEYRDRQAAGEDLGCLWRAEIEETPTTWTLEDQLPTGLENLVALTSSDWLDAEAEKTYRFSREFRSSLFHLVAGTRLGSPLEPPRPHRFAQMLLVARDFVRNPGPLC